MKYNCFDTTRPFGEVLSTEYLMNYRRRTEYRMTRDEFINRLSEYRDGRILCDGLRVINKLISDPALYDKMVFCTDGSYRQNRILFYRNSDGHLNIAPEIRLNINDPIVIKNQIRLAKLPSDSIMKIDWIYRHFDHIFVQMPSEDPL